MSVDSSQDPFVSQLGALHFGIGILNAQALQLAEAHDLMLQLVPEHDLVVHRLQFVDAAAFEVPHRLGDQRVRDAVLGLGQADVLHIPLGELLAIKVEVISHARLLI